MIIYNNNTTNIDLVHENIRKENDTNQSINA